MAVFEPVEMTSSPYIMVLRDSTASFYSFGTAPSFYRFRNKFGNGTAKTMSEIENLEVIIRSYTKFFIAFDIIVFASAIIVILLTIKFLKSKNKLEKTSGYLRAIIQGQEAERTRISRELHDTVAQDLRYCKNLAEKLGESEMSVILKKSLSQVRALSGNLAPPDITKKDLTANIFDLCQMINQQIKNDAGNKLEIRFVESGKVDTSFLTEEENLNLYRIVQESLVNILKHADASEATVLLRNAFENEKKGIYIFVTDDGKGFDAEKPTPSGHFGLAEMSERARLIGAILKVESEIGEGTQISVEKLFS